MHAMEMARKAGFLKKAYALAITVAPDSEQHMMAELRHVKERLIEWKRHRGNSCETIMFTIVSDPELHPFLKDLLAKIYADETDLRPILSSVKVNVGLLDKGGKPKHKYALGET